MRFVGDDKPVDLPVLQASTFQAEFFSVGCPKPSLRQRWKQPAILPSLNVKTARSRHGIVPFTHLAREGRMTVTIGRRELLAALGGAAAAWPHAERPQQPDRMRRIGVLMNLAADDVEGQQHLAAFLQGLQEAGWEVGRNVRIDIRSTGDIELNSKYAMELLALAPDVFLAAGAPTVRAPQT